MLIWLGHVSDVSAACSHATLCSEKAHLGCFVSWCQLVCLAGEGHANGAKVTGCRLHGWWAGSLTCGRVPGPCS